MKLFQEALFGALTFFIQKLTVILERRTSIANWIVQRMISLFERFRRFEPSHFWKFFLACYRLKT